MNCVKRRKTVLVYIQSERENMRETYRKKIAREREKLYDDDIFCCHYSNTSTEIRLLKCVYDFLSIIFSNYKSNLLKFVMLANFLHKIVDHVLVNFPF